MIRKPKSKEEIKFYKKYKIDHTKEIKSVNEIPTFNVVDNCKPIQESLSGNCFKRSIHDHKWKLNKEENSNTVREIELKSKQISIPYNKGSYQYITPESSLKDLGKK